MNAEEKKYRNAIAKKLFLELLLATIGLAIIRLLLHRFSLIGVEWGIVVFALSFVITGVVLIRKGIRQFRNMETVHGHENRLAKLVSFLDSTPDPILIADQNGFVRLSNGNTEKIFGCSKEELVGQRMEKLITESHQGAYTKKKKGAFYDSDMVKAIETGAEHFAIRKDGTEVPVEIFLTTVDMEDSTWMSASFRDISQRKKAEKELKEFEYFFRVSSDFSCIANEQGFFEKVNPVFLKSLGYSEKELLSTPSFDFYHPDDVEVNIKIFEKIKQGTPVISFVSRMRKKDGDYLWLDWKGTANASNKKIYAVARDITEKIEQEKISQRLASIIEFSSDGIISKKPDGTVLTWNRGAEKITGYSAKDIIGNSISILFPEELKYEEAVLMDKIKSGQAVEQYSTVRVKKDGTRIHLSITLSPIKDESGNIIAVSKIMRDISASKLDEEKLKSLSDFQNIILNGTDYSIITNRLDGVISTFNKGAEKMLGYSAEEVVGITDPSLFHDSDEVLNRANELSQELGRIIEPGYETFVAKALSGVADTNEWTYIKKDGSRISIELTVTALRSSDNTIKGYMGIAKDITEKKKADEKLRNYSILESKSKEMEQFAYIASHDLREPLLTIKNYIEILLEDWAGEQNEEVIHYTNTISEAASRMEARINGLLDYSRLSKIKQAQQTDCNKVIHEVLEDLTALTSSTKACIKVDPLPVLPAHPIELSLLFQNLITNAIKFRSKDTVPQIHISAKSIMDGWQFQVTDNGIGIDEAYRLKIFEIFQRLHTRNEYEGTGIGLAHCKKIAEIHNGTIWVESTPGEGSSFYFTIIN